MPETLQVGPLMINSGMLVYIAGIAIGFLLMRLRLKNTEYVVKPIFDLLMNNILIVVLFWKLGPLLFMPSILWTKPYLILLMAGSYVEILIGIAVAIVYTLYKIRKLEIPLLVFLDALPYGILSTLMFSSLLLWQYGQPTSMPWGITVTGSHQYHPVNIYLLILSAMLLLWLWRSTYKLGKGKVVQDFLIYYAVGLWIISYTQIPTRTFLFITPEQMFYMGMIVLGIMIPYIIRRTERS